MRKSYLKSPLGIVFKITVGILSIFWIAMCLNFTANCFSRKYLYPTLYKEAVIKYSDYYGLNSTLIFSVIKVESSFNKNAVSDAGALGLMQITPDTGKYIAKLQGIERYDLTDPTTNINFGCYYIKYLIMKFDNLDTALCAYNAGEGNVSLWLQNKEYSADGTTLTNVPFTETREYIKKIHQTFSKYKKLYGNILDKR
ncbi:MAG: lytic transglycosylase domain-containing protein [Clostridia bacterium]|nr:lytic transglycosylase domain-containing protein [Clostridia bacterium]